MQLRSGPLAVRYRMARLFAANLKGPVLVRWVWVGNGKDLVRNSSLCKHDFESKKYRQQGNFKKVRPMVIFSDHKRAACLVVQYHSFTSNHYNQVQHVLHSCVIKKRRKSIFQTPCITPRQQLLAYKSEVRVHAQVPGFSLTCSTQMCN